MSRSVSKCVRRRVVVLIVDALRFDFAPELKTVEQMLEKEKDRSRLLQFVADAPTTTMQRLKGLTTGGLPTVSDLSFHRFPDPLRKTFGTRSVSFDSVLRLDVEISRQGVGQCIESIGSTIV